MKVKVLTLAALMMFSVASIFAQEGVLIKTKADKEKVQIEKRGQFAAVAQAGFSYARYRNTYERSQWSDIFFSWKVGGTYEYTVTEHIALETGLKFSQLTYGDRNSIEPQDDVTKRLYSLEVPLYLTWKGKLTEKIGYFTQMGFGLQYAVAGWQDDETGHHEYKHKKYYYDADNPKPSEDYPIRFGNSPSQIEDTSYVFLMQAGISYKKYKTFISFDTGLTNIRNKTSTAEHQRTAQIGFAYLF